MDATVRELRLPEGFAGMLEDNGLPLPPLPLEAINELEQIDEWFFATDGREMVLHLVRGGNTIGEAAMFLKGTFTASAVAVDDVETLFLPAEALFALVTENPEMALRMLAALSLRLRMFAHKLAAQGQGGAACRLATYLLHRRQIGGGDCIRLGVSREVLANLLGLARETLSRQLSRFSEAGLVELRVKDIIILDVPALQATAAEGDR